MKVRQTLISSRLLAVLLGASFMCAAQAQIATPSSSVGASTAATAAETSLEVPLMTGNLGRAVDVNTITGNATATGLNNGLNASTIQGLGGRAALQGQQGLVGSGAQSQNIRADLGGMPSLGTTQFQSFVQESTGKSLPLFGYNLFDRSRFPSLTDVPVPANYVIGPGDEIDLKIWGAVDVAMRLPVDRNGQITIPKVGPVTVTGTPSGDLDAYLKKQIGRVYNNFELSASIGRLRSIQIYVVGQARNPGAYTVSSLSTLINALFESGGPSANGSMRSIHLTRNGKNVTTIDLYKFILSGETTADTRLLPGDVIVIPPAGPRVAVHGSTDHPAIFELASSEESISQVLSYSAGSQTLTSPHKALLERVNNQIAKAPREVKDLVLDTAGLNTKLHDGDLLTLFKISSQFSNAVTLRGNVASPLRYVFKTGMRVSDLIPETDALIMPDYYSRKNSLVQHESGRNISDTRVVGEVKRQLSEINWDYASIERLDPKAVKTILIPFNLGKAIKDKDPENNIELLPGDIVTIFGIDDIPVPLEKRTQFVRVGGEVKIPGIYQLTPGETLPELIRRAGGLTRNAFAYGTVFTRESTRAQQQENLNKAIRRMEQDINSQAATALQNVIDTERGNNVQAQLAGQRIMLSRLQGLRVSGRIALDLDPENPIPPAITLEDGDTITIPIKPSFIGVYGEVNAESSLLHKPGFTVDDYLNKAGVTRDSDLDNVMLIRADGTSETGSRSRAIWKSGILSKQLNPGDTIFVPAVVDRRSGYTAFVQGAKDWTQILSNLGIGVAAWRAMGY